VTNLQVSTGTPYEIVKNDTDCCANSMGPAWLDWPFVLQRNFGAGPTDPLFLIRTSIADTPAPQNPLMKFNVNRCAQVMVTWGEDGGGPGCDRAYPTWITDEGWDCSVENCGGTVNTYQNEDPQGSPSQVRGPWCVRTFEDGPVELGPADIPLDAPPGGLMYSVFIQAEDCP
jgi:hypothetical protein